MNMLLIDVPSYIDNDDELADWIRENSELFWPAMNLDVSQTDDRETIDDVTIIEVEIEKKTVAIHYDYEYSAYYGCKDMNYSDTSQEDVIIGQRKGGTIVFEKFKPFDRRSTDNEF